MFTLGAGRVFNFERVKLWFLRRKWRKCNNHNFTGITRIIQTQFFSFNNVSVGKMSYGGLELHCFGALNEGLKIGNFVSIASGVKFILGGNHHFNTFSTYPFRVNFLNQSQEAWSKGVIIVEDDVWIGTDVILLSGVRIGRGSVIGAGAVVAKDIPPYAIAVGNPVKIIKYRFDEALRNQLMEFDFARIDHDFVTNNFENLYTDLSENVLSSIIMPETSNSGSDLTSFQSK